jgi:hypothetical protein
VVPRVCQSSCGDIYGGRRSQLGLQPTRHRQSSFDPHMIRSNSVQDMMGTLLRCKILASVVLGSTRDDFLFGPTPSSLGTPITARASMTARDSRRQSSYSGATRTSEAGKAGRRRISLSIGSLIMRKQVSLDLYAPEQAEFFGAPLEEEPEVPTSVTRKQTGSSNNGTTF